MKFIIVLVLSIFLLLSPFALKGGSEKLNNINSEQLLHNLKNPPAEYGIILWWGWDGPVNETIIIRDLDYIRSLGFKGVMIEAGYGMNHQYLSPEWFQLVKFAVEQAHMRDMKVWIEDEGKYPSGFAGGKFSAERPDLKMQGLVIKQKIKLNKGDNININLPDNILSAVAINLQDSTNQIIKIDDKKLIWLANNSDYDILLAGYDFRTSPTRSVNNLSRKKDTSASLFDYLNPEGTRQFIEWTHQQYKQNFGNEFGITFMGFMGDEPDFSYTPWTTNITDIFYNAKGYDIKPYLASFFVKNPINEVKLAKADYWDVWSSIFSKNYFGLFSDWCKQNNVKYIVHLNHEDDAPALIKSEGDFFKIMKEVHVPGVDAIWSQIWMDHVADYPKLASSAAHVFGKPRAFTESFAAYTYKPSVAQAKWVLDYQLARGINFIQIMFMPSSANNINRPKTFFTSDSFPQLADYLNRASYILSMGRPAAKIALYYPTMTMWMGDIKANTACLKLAQILLENQFDFDFVDEQAFLSALTINENTLENLSKQAYKFLIIPPLSVISKKTLKKIDEFLINNGKVIFIDKFPDLLVDTVFLYASRFKYDGKIPIIALDDFESNLNKYITESDVIIDKRIPELKYIHRSLDDGDLYFFFNESTNKFNTKIKVRGRGDAKIINAYYGELTELKYYNDKDFIQCRLDFDAWQSVFLLISHK
jgi:hypothetical protein